MTIGMHCPECNHEETGVTDSRTHDGIFVRRRRLCPECQHRFTTFEVQFDDVYKLKKMLNGAAGMVPIEEVAIKIRAVLRQYKSDI